MRFETLFLELVDSTNMINALLAGISDDEARVKPTAETWSILEVLCHLYDEEREDFRLRLRFILGPRDEWHDIHPSAWVTERGYNTRSLREMKEKFFGERISSALRPRTASNTPASGRGPLRNEKRPRHIGLGRFYSWIMTSAGGCRAAKSHPRPGRDMPGYPRRRASEAPCQSSRRTVRRDAGT